MGSPHSNCTISKQINPHLWRLKRYHKPICEDRRVSITNCTKFVIQTACLSALSIFQASCNGPDIKGQISTVCYLDDILIILGKDAEENITCLQDHGMKLKLAECKFFQTSIEYLGIDANGLPGTTSNNRKGKHSSQAI